jgi:hypothetical protein
MLAAALDEPAPCGARRRVCPPRPTSLNATSALARSPVDLDHAILNTSTPAIDLPVPSVLVDVGKTRSSARGRPDSCAEEER